MASKPLLRAVQNNVRNFIQHNNVRNHRTRNLRKSPKNFYQFRRINVNVKNSSKLKTIKESINPIASFTRRSSLTSNSSNHYKPTVQINVASMSSVQQPPKANPKSLSFIVCIFIKTI